MASLTMTMSELSSQLSNIGLKSDMPEIPAADVLANPLDIFRSHLASLIASAVHCDLSSAYDSIADSSMGDLEVILPKLKLMDKSSSDSANSINVSQKLQPSPFFTAPFADGPRIRFYFSPMALPKLLLPYIEDRKSSYGHHVSEGFISVPDTENHIRKKVIVEFSSPNVGSEFKGAHLRSTLIGAFISNMYECMGWEAVRLNYLGDWGKNLALLAIGFQRFGSEELLQSNPLHHMLEVYQKISALLKPEQDEIKRLKDEGHSTTDLENKGISAERDAFLKKLEEQDEEAIGLWSRFRNLAIECLRAPYDRMGIQFDEYSGESQIKPETMLDVEKQLKAHGFLEENDEGSWVIDFTKHAGKAGKGLGVHVLRNHDGTSTYLLRDIGAVIDRYEKFSFDKMIYVVSSRQSSHFQQLSIVLNLMGRKDLEEKIQYVSFGEIQGLEKNSNNTPLLENIIDDCIHSLQVSAVASEVSPGPSLAISPDALAVSALLSKEISVRKRSHGYELNPNQMVSDDHDVSFNLEHFHAKLSHEISALQTGDLEAVLPDPSIFEDDTTAELLGILARYPEVTAATFKTLEPHTIFTYMSQLAETLDLSGSDDEEEENNGIESPEARRAHLELYQCVLQVVENGMRLLGFLVPEV